jgi:hypothetical protein
MKKIKLFLMAIFMVGIIGLAVSVNAAQKEVINPIAKYEFNDAANPGKDSMGNHHLVLKNADGKPVEGAKVNVVGGVATFDGSAGLIAVDQTTDLGEVVESFTLAFDIKTTKTHGEWAFPVAFGWNDWGATKWGNFHFSGESDMLRFSTASNLIGGKSEVDNTENPYWGPEVGALGTTEFHRVILSAQLGGKMTVYLDGVQKLQYDLPAEYSLRDPNMRFSLGGVSCWGNLYSPFYGDLKNVQVYDFAFDAEQVAEYNTDGQVTKLVILTVKSIAKVDLSATVKVLADATEEEVLLHAPSQSPVQVTMSDDSIVQGVAQWTGVELVDGVKHLVGNLVGDLSNPNNIKAYAKIGFVDSVQEILPVARYEFNDPQNPGKDAMGNYHLKIITPPEQTGQVVVENGAAKFDGSAILIANSNENDISENLGSFTMSFSIVTTESGSNWAEPIGFGWDDWSPKAKWFLFEMSPGSKLLRFTTASSRDAETGQSDVDGNDNQWWGPELVETATTQHIIVSVDLEGKIVVYVNGVAKYSHNTPAGYSMSERDMYFAVGGNGTWGAMRNPFVGEISNLAIYDFAVNAEQAKVLNKTHKVNTNTMSKPYVVSVNETPVFVNDKVAKVELNTAMTVEEMLAEINEAKVVATLSNDTTKDIPVVWNEVVETEGVYKVLGSVKVVDHNIISTVHNIDVEVKLTVVDVLESVSIAKAPTKVEYKVGEALDLAGAKLKLTMASGATSEVEITSAMVTGFDSSAPGTVTVTVAHEGKTATFTVTVADVLSSVSVAKAPTKVEYKVGEALDLAGAKLKLTMASGATSEVEITSAMVTGFDSSTPGTVTVSVTYEGKTTTFTVTIVKAEDPVSKKGCKGSIAASIIGLSLVLGVVVFIKRRK